ncbi:hypothetical protein CYJ27_06485 [Aerococcus christensenii]|uniref:RNA polymerase sigma factor, sigma-70 family n=1 Tax=Aerococcus christensenii TaxID=87541 RepID=A0A0X8F8G6_9LACT|nr:hypothetical protein [Aerococcus christensenii]AMB92520.1 hypothetical protein AWM71_04035 [Aerococcus christensenii]KXB37596.1 RNA polymerase sigma factor, sigma-70 family [Aerococcus christensenii]MDK8233698.1 hypothetical protein [Aerococcus christensenii]PKY91088.1 hypothetical protein CYJ27_06485 [Aerococcus christensenii]WEB71123.1 hypothetical protein PUW42_00675 [Aerococcus christensenii]
MNNFKEYDHIEDRELMIAFFENNDQIAFEALLHRYQPTIYYFFNKYRFWIEDFQEYFQLASLCFFQVIVEKYKKQEEYSLKAALGKRIESRLIDMKRQQGRMKRIPKDKVVYYEGMVDEDTGTNIFFNSMPQSTYPTPESALFVKEKYKAYLMRLSPLEKQVLEKYIQKKTDQEIAEELSTSSDVVKRAYYRLCHKWHKHD